MTLLIIFLSVTNIALGFGLAIYLGHVRAPWAPDKRTTSYRPPACRRKSRESQDIDTGTIGQPGNEKNDEAAAEAVVKTVAETTDELAEEVAEVEEEPGAKDETQSDEKSIAEIAG